jgi:hypothetical protein
MPGKCNILWRHGGSKQRSLQDDKGMQQLCAISRYGTNPVNHYLPRTETKVHVDEHLLEAENPLFLEVVRKHYKKG